MRIVSLSPSTTEILFALGAGDDLIGVTTFCNYPAEAKQLSKVGGWSTADIQKVFDLKPDLVLTSTIVQHRALELFKGASFRHLHVDPRNMTDIFNSIVAIAQLVNRDAEAIELIEMMQSYIDIVTEAAKQLGRPPRVYCEEWPSPPMVSGNWVPELVRLAGAEYFPLADQEISRQVSDAEIVAFNPEIIVLNYCGFGLRSHPKAVTKRPGWQQISAVANNRIFVIDDTYLNRPGPRIVIGLTQLAQLIEEFTVSQRI